MTRKKSDVKREYREVKSPRETGRRGEAAMERRADSGMKRRPEAALDRRQESLQRRTEATGNHLQRDLQEVRRAKAEIVEKMVDKGDFIHDGNKVDNAKDLHFQSETSYYRELQRREPGIGKDMELVAGYCDPRDNQAFVRDKGKTLETAVHEKLHQKSKSEMPTRFNEGVTEYLTRQISGEVGRFKEIDHRGREISGFISDYEKEREVVGKIAATVGDAPLHAAYFEGNTDILRAHVDSAFGPDSYQEITEALEERNYDRAERALQLKGIQR